jgi:mRNA interferase MazF
MVSTLTLPKMKKTKNDNTENTIVRRMDIYYADLRGGNAGSEQSGERPVLILQNDIGNKYSPTTIVAAISTSMTKAKLPTHIVLEPEKTGLPERSIALLEQIRTIDKYRLINKIGTVDPDTKIKIEQALGISVGLA